MRLIRDKVKEETWMCKKVCDMAERGELRSDYFLQRDIDQWNLQIVITLLLRCY